MTRRPEDFDTLSNPSTLWLLQEADGFDLTTRIALRFRDGNLLLDIEVGGDGAIHIDNGSLTPERVAELRDQLTAWLQWAGHESLCEHVIARFKPYCSEMVCHNYAGRHQSDGKD